ncbi:MAG TPA: serine hydrolase domain-containing protein [Candidatus Limnocylindrales bacterium]|nr:serine hydrolase domain-containing protein [Candidatus Limnocylindrales bacterium]
MAEPQPRRTGVRLAIPLLPLALVATLASGVLDPAAAATPTATPRPASTPSEPAGVDPVPSVTGAPDATSTPIVGPSPGPEAGSPPVIAPPQSITRPRLAPQTRLALQARLDRLRQRYAIPGVSVAIVLPDGSTWSGVSGLADVPHKLAVTRSTSFAIASVSKTFTAALILALAEDGRIDLDASVRTYLPGLKKVSSKVKVRQLLDHTSGLRDYFFHPSIDHLLLSRPDRRWDSARSLKYVGKPYFEPGKGWHYSNTNYLVLGMIAEAVAKEPLADQVRTRFLDPLGLEHTWYQPEDVPQTDVAHGYRFASTSTAAAAIDLSDGTPLVPFTSVVTAAGAAGGFASTARDLAHWAHALYSGEVLRPEYLAAMIDADATTALKSTIPYGYGTQVVEIDGHRTLGHSGRLLGFRSSVRYLPDQGVAIAVLTNQSRTDPATIVRNMLRIALTPVEEPCGCRQRR